ncbi:MAG TPA: hypothetical protein PLF01_01135 [Alphaproteobacteria bacterium]|nr:hypothetical protein [Alphaproteobacteria bacterium]
MNSTGRTKTIYIIGGPTAGGKSAHALNWHNNMTASLLMPTPCRFTMACRL